MLQQDTEFTYTGNISLMSYSFFKLSLLTVLFSVIFIRGSVSVFAQEDFRTPKFGIFYPDMTATPSPAPSQEPVTDLPIDEETSPDETTKILPTTPPNAPRILSPSPISRPTSTPTPNPYYCRQIGLPLYTPQPRFMNSTLCSSGAIAPPYGSSFVPRNLVNLQDALGSRYWVRDRGTQIRGETIANLKLFLDYLKTLSCVPMVAYGYRDYNFQSYLFDTRNCSVNPGCGVAPPGKSVHQAGIAIDLFCAKMGRDGSISIDRVPDTAIQNAKQWNMIHPVSWDTPHFISL